MHPTTTSHQDIFDELINRHRALIRSVCWLHSSFDESLCRELIHDCYVSIWCHLPSLRSDTGVLGQRMWVYWQCRSTISHRFQTKRPELLRFTDEMAETVAIPDDTSLSEMIDEYAVTLNEREHLVLKLLLEGYNNGEIAQLMGLKSDSVKKIRQRIIRKMRDRALNNND